MAVPVALLNLSLSSSWVVMAITGISTLGDHSGKRKRSQERKECDFTSLSSGYHLPFLHSPQFHDWHHLKFTECYGACDFMDKFHGTSQKFEQTVNFKRHKTLFTLKSASELYPDEVNVKVKSEENNNAEKVIDFNQKKSL
jgi:sterol desaturase/sphingolipid hydroxylase (fatty acid hydroxylase superfamily)